MTCCLRVVPDVIAHGAEREAVPGSIGDDDGLGGTALGTLELERRGEYHLSIEEAF